jgi:hypothetical protein
MHIYVHVYIQIHIHIYINIYRVCWNSYNNSIGDIRPYRWIKQVILSLGCSVISVAFYYLYGYFSFMPTFHMLRIDFLTPLVCYSCLSKHHYESSSLDCGFRYNNEFTIMAEIQFHPSTFYDGTDTCLKEKQHAVYRAFNTGEVCAYVRMSSIICTYVCKCMLSLYNSMQHFALHFIYEFLYVLSFFYFLFSTSNYVSTLHYLYYLCTYSPILLFLQLNFRTNSWYYRAFRISTN